jgi:hypothetical protein
MARRVLLPEKCNKSCIGLDLWRLLGKFRPVSCMMSEDKSIHGAWRLKVPIQRTDTSSANGKRLGFFSFCYTGLKHATLFQVQALPRTSCAPRSEHGRPTFASHTRKEAIHRRSRELTSFTQPGKKPIHLIIDFLSCMWEYAKEQITREIGAVADLGQREPR